MADMGSNALGIMFNKKSLDYYDEIYIDIPKEIYTVFDTDERDERVRSFITDYLDNNPAPFYVVFDTESYTNNNMLLKTPLMWAPKK